MKKLNLDSKQKAQLEEEFKNLRTIEEKFNFWLERLKLHYCLWLNKPLEEYKVFQIYPENQLEIEKLNTMSLNQYKERFRMFTPARKILEFEELKSNFYKELEESTNKKNYIEYEIKKIENIVFEKEISKDEFEKELNGFFLFGYKKYYLNNIPPDLQKGIHSIENLLEWYNGYVIAQYHLFLNVKLKKPVEKNQFSHVVQMIILEYLGIGENTKIDRERAEIYAPLINRDVETTRVYFYKLGQEKSIYNLKIVRDYFEKAGLTDKMNRVQEDIESEKAKEKLNEKLRKV